MSTVKMKLRGRQDRESGRMRLCGGGLNGIVGRRSGVISVSFKINSPSGKMDCLNWSPARGGMRYTVVYSEHSRIPDG
jgi:hypothetical protein